MIFVAKQQMPGINMYVIKFNRIPNFNTTKTLKQIETASTEPAMAYYKKSKSNKLIKFKDIFIKGAEIMNVCM